MYDILLAVAVIIIIALCVGIYNKNTNGVCVSRKRLDGRTVVVTGGTLGIGLVTATDLAHRGARVIIACPFQQESLTARDQIIQETENKNVIFKHLDLASLTSVRKFATDILNTENRLDILVNNAGVGVPGDFLTDDGMHFIMQVNYYGTVLLTLLLLPLLKKTGTEEEPSRILTTSSTLHLVGKIAIKDFNKVKYWNKLRIYSNSKLCLIYFVKKLAKKLEGTNVIINNVDPGTVGTTIFTSFNTILGYIAMLICYVFLKTVWEGAQPTIYGAVDKRAGQVSGEYLRNCEVSSAASWTNSEQTAEDIWKHTTELIKITDDELDQCFK